jgi:hypothetical protein
VTSSQMPNGGLAIQSFQQVFAHWPWHRRVEVAPQPLRTTIKVRLDRFGSPSKAFLLGRIAGKAIRIGWTMLMVSPSANETI